MCSVAQSSNLLLYLKCVYPFTQPDVEGLITKLPHNDLRYSKKQKTRSSSVVNTTPPLKAADDDNDSVEFAEEFSLDDFDTSSFTKQTDELFSAAIAEEMLFSDDVTSECSVDYDPTITSILNFYSDITQVFADSSATAATPTPKPTTTAAANNSSNAPSNFSLQDIEFLLTDNSTVLATATTATATTTTTSPPKDVDRPAVSVVCTPPTSPSSPNLNTPKDDTNLNWIEDLDVIFGDAMTKTQFNPLDGDTEFDSVLGI